MFKYYLNIIIQKETLFFFNSLSKLWSNSKSQLHQRNFSMFPILYFCLLHNMTTDKRKIFADTTLLILSPLYIIFWSKKQTPNPRKNKHQILNIVLQFQHTKQVLFLFELLCFRCIKCKVTYLLYELFFKWVTSSILPHIILQVPIAAHLDYCYLISMTELKIKYL